MNEVLAPNEKIEDLLCDGLKIIVRTDGFHYGSDSIMLANFVKASSGANIVELCSGTGVISILLSAKTRAAHIIGVEIDESLVSLANRSAAMNGIEDRVNFVCGDICNINNIRNMHNLNNMNDMHNKRNIVNIINEANDILRHGSAGVVVANPPYLKSGSGTGSRDAGSDAARREIYCELADVTTAAGWLLRQGGAFYIVYRMERLVDLFCAMRNSGIEPKVLQPVCASIGKPSPFILVSGKKGAAPGLIFRKQIVI